MSNEEHAKTDMPGLTKSTTQSQETGTNGIDVRTQSTFSRCGSITLEKAALKIEYEAFRETRVAYISPAGLRSLTEKTVPVDVEEVREGIDGTIVISQVGKAWRSRSGKALMVRTTQSDGEVLVPWTQFKKVLEGRLAKATVSRFGIPPPPKPRPRPSSGISNGLEGGFGI